MESTCRIANVLKKEGVSKGDRVALYMPASPPLAATMLACARIGAIHRYTCSFIPCYMYIIHAYNTVSVLSVVFAGFSAESLRNRINDGTLTRNIHV